MPKLLTTLAVLIVAVTLAYTAEGAETFKARLTQGDEVPTPVATNASGSARIQINKAETEGEFTLSVSEGFRVTQAHLHCNFAGLTGPIVVFLAGLHAGGLNVDGKWVSNATFTDSSIVNTACGTTVAELAESMRIGKVYVNVHTVLNPAGEVRGQVEPTGND